MQDSPDESLAFNAADPLRNLTAAQFMALGGNAVVYVRPISGAALSKMMADGDTVADDAEFQLVVSADGSPLMVGDSKEAVAEWLGERSYGVVSLH